MQKIVLFIEPPREKWWTPLKIGNLFTNRFAIDEDGCHEILKIHHLDNTFRYYYYNEGRFLLDDSFFSLENEGLDRILQQNNLNRNFLN